VPLASALSAIGILAGCADQPLGTFERAEYRVQSASQGLYGLRFAPGSARLAPEEEQGLVDFLAAIAALDLDQVLLSHSPSGSPVLDRNRLAVVTRAAAFAGVPSRLLVVEGRTPPRAEPAPDVILVEPLRRGQLLVACPSQRRGHTEEAFMTPLPSLGCANAANLAHMAANRTDLIVPRPLGHAIGAVEVAAVMRHRNGEVARAEPIETNQR
jgi:type IV pilus biogenesis protein CpaD/CtpE